MVQIISKHSITDNETVVFDGSAVHLSVGSEFQAFYVLFADPRRCEVYSLKGVTVLAHKSAVTAYPKEALARLSKRVGLRCRQSVGIIVKHRRVVVTAAHRVDCDFIRGIIPGVYGALRK